MKRTTLLAVAIAAAFAGCASVAIDDSQIGLSKGSVFDVATPAPFDFESSGAGETTPPAAGSGMPPMISHSIDDSLPITVAKNDCRSCHDKPDAIGRTTARGKATPAPVSHYVRQADGKAALAGRNYNCVACHAPQSGAKPLVGNTSL
jgi:nitrate reductase (cytochrome), electron transfer subunit